MSRPFADVVRELAGGDTYRDLSDGLAEVVQAVMATRKGGKITLELTIKPNGENSVSIIDDVKIKVPTPPRGQNIFFTTADGALLRNDPRQKELPLKAVADNSAGGELKEVTG